MHLLGIPCVYSSDKVLQLKKSLALLFINFSLEGWPTLLALIYLVSSHSLEMEINMLNINAHCFSLSI